MTDDNTNQLQHPPNENSCAWQSPTDPAFGTKPGQCYIKKTRGCIIRSHPAAEVGAILLVDQPVANELVSIGSAIFCTKDGRELNPSNSSSRRVRLLKSIQIAGHPKSRPGDVLTLDNNLANELVFYGQAQEVAESGWRKLAAKIGIV